MCAAFEEYEDVLEMVLFDFREDDMKWVASKISGDARALGDEEIYLCNWIIHFGCTSEELRVGISDTADWNRNSYPTRAGRLSPPDGMFPSGSG